MMYMYVWLPKYGKVWGSRERKDLCKWPSGWLEQSALMIMGGSVGGVKSVE